MAERDKIDDLIERLGDLPTVTDVDPLIEAIVDRIGSVNRHLTVNAKDTLGKHGITWREWHVLVHLQLAGACSPKELSERLVTTTGATTNVLDKMERAGLVRRRRNPDDARSVIVEPTAKGNGVWEKAVNEQGRWESAAVAGALSETEQKQLNRLLRKLLAGLSKPED